MRAPRAAGGLKLYYSRVSTRRQRAMSANTSIRLTAIGVSGPSGWTSGSAIHHVRSPADTARECASLEAGASR